MMQLKVKKIKQNIEHLKLKKLIINHKEIKSQCN